MHIRNATEHDLEQILAIYNEVILNTTAVYDYKPHTLDMRRDWFNTKAQQGFPIYVAEEDGKVFGLSSLGPFRQWAAYRYTVENSIYVSAESRGKGIGKLLLPPLIKAAEELQMHAIVAGIDASNEASIKLHEHFGFTQVAHFKEVGFKFNKWLDLKFLQLTLKTPENPNSE